ncbi:MAG: hypothetical protein DI587_02835 [Variovorax paradoxus]|nr:MAG: hypothetical protein DI583_02835 [Variovorax paradoxus]PZQ15640.1 MAG: hypothetical protein DI587_02835 [Variovorax paradoxus]
MVFALRPGSPILDRAGPAEALRAANQCLRAQGRAKRFQLRFAGPQPETASCVGAQIAGVLPGRRLTTHHQLDEWRALAPAWRW